MAIESEQQTKPESRRKLLKVGICLALFNAILIIILSIKGLQLAPPNLPFSHNLYLWLFSSSYLSVLAMLPMLFVFIPAVMLCENRKKACMLWGAGAYTLFLIILLIDSYVFSLYRFHINHTVIEQIAGPGAGQVFEISFVIYLIAIIVLAVIFALEIFLFLVSYKLIEKGINKFLYAAIGCIGIILIVTQIIHAKATAEDDRSLTCYDSYLPVSKPLNVNSMLRLLGKNVPSDKNYDFNGHQYDYPIHAIEDSATNMNIVIIALDSWTSTTLDSTICPNIYNFSKNCAVFNHHYSGGNCTRNGLFSIMYGLPGVYWYDFRDQNITPVLIRELEKHDYDISLYPSASLRNPPFDKNAFYTVKNQCEATEGDKAWQRDKKLSENFITYLRSRNKNRPFFSLLFFDSLHSMLIPDNFKAPFQPTWNYPEYMNLNNETDPTPYKNLYKNMVNYVDNYFKNIIDELKAQKLLKNTIIIVTGDHGQEFNENKKNFWGHNGNFSKYQLEVPLLYYSPKRMYASYSHWSSHKDIVPTLMQEVFTVSNPISDYSTGKNLFDTTKRQYMQVDGYNGLGIIDTTGEITYILYDGDYEIVDEHLNNEFDKKFDDRRYQEVINSISSFYSHKKE